MLWVIPLFGGELGTGGGGVEAKFDAFVGGEIAEHTGAGVGDEIGHFVVFGGRINPSR